MRSEKGLDLCVDDRISDVPDELAGGPTGGKALVLGFPFLKSPLVVGILEGPAFGLAADAAAPRFRRQSRAEALLGFAELPIEPVSSEGLEDAIGRLGIGSYKACVAMSRNPERVR